MPKKKNPEFARLLSMGIGAIAAKQDKAKGIIQDEIGYALNRTGKWVVQRWGQGYVPDDEAVETLARSCVTQGGMDKEWLIRFLQTAVHPNSDSIVSALFPESTKILHNLPRRDYTQFVGRQHELEQIASWLLPVDRAWLLTVEGIGGIGKSTLALEAVYRLLERRPPFVINTCYEAIIWVSAKQEFLTLDGPIPSSDFFRTLDDIYTAIGEVLQRQDILRAQPGDQGRLVKRVLSQHQVLLVVDNLESVADKTVFDFLRILPGSSKALVTSRQRIYISELMHLVELSRPEVLSLIEEKTKTKTCHLGEEQKEKLYRRTGGIPLAITLTLARIGAGFPVESVLADLGKVQKDLVRYCIHSSVEALQSEDARRILMALSLFAVNASYEALKVVSGFSDDQLSYDEALAHLQEFSLIDEWAEKNNNVVTTQSPFPAPGKRYTMLPPTRDYAHHLLVGGTALRQEMSDRQVSYYSDMLTQLGYGDSPEQLQRLSNLDHERENLLSLMTYLYEHEAWQIVIQFVAYLHGYLSHRGHWSDYLKWVDRAINASKMLEIPGMTTLEIQRALGWCLSARCWIQSNLGELDQARSAGQAAIALFNSVKDQDGEAQVLRRIGLIERIKQNFEEAENHYRQALTIWQATDNRREIASIYNNLGDLALRQGKLTDAETWLLKSLTIKEELADISRLGNNYYHLGEVYFLQNNLQQAKEFFQKVQNTDDSSNNISYKPRAKFSLAKMAVIEGDIQTATRLAKEGQELFDQLGEEDEYQEVSNFLSEIKEA